VADDAGFITLFTEFGHELRAVGMPIGSDDVMAYCSAIAELNPSDILDIYWAGRSTLVSKRDHIPLYDNVFRAFFLDEKAEFKNENRLKIKAASSAQAVIDIPAPESGTPGSTEEETRLGLQASTSELFRNKTFASCTPEELAALRRIMSRIKLTPPRRRTRRKMASARGSLISMRKMVRETMRAHGEPRDLYFTKRRLRLRPLVLILDVSGSMADYSRNLLQFAYSAQRAADRVEVFCFGTRLTRITRALDRKRPDDAMNTAAGLVFDWDGGTRIGDSLEMFTREWGRRGMSRGSIVVICSDGLDRGEPEVLSRAMEKLSRLSFRIVWMNPHKGDNENFSPNTLGMMVAEPFIDEIVSGHSLKSLEEFSSTLTALR
jgi:uncharacterized protein with von Willebrand factor type A (vWA) domain